jgi:glycyl-tRNA synthetase beta chain
MAQRVERLQALAEAIAPFVGADPAKAREAARLAKADLASGMVGEFPELQGLMGGYYAREAGLSNVIAEAISDHYRPVGPRDEVPEAPVSMAVALADKIDTLVGFFAIGEKPTGSKDPYALRRSALGLIRILLNSEIRLPVGELVAAWYRTLKTYVGEGRGLYVSTHRTTATLGARWREANGDFGPYFEEFEEALLEGRPHLIEVAGEPVEIEFDRAVKAPLPPKAKAVLEFRPYGEVRADIADFLADRLQVALRDQGRRHDLVAAVFALGDDDLVRIVARVQALDGFLKTEDGKNLLAGYKRGANILKAEEKKGPLPTGPAARLEGAPAQEHALLDAVEHVRPQVGTALQGEHFAQAMAALASLRGPVDAFFEGVLVNSDKAEERDNRLRLLSQVRDLMGEVADFSQISG